MTTYSLRRLHLRQRLLELFQSDECGYTMSQDLRAELSRKVKIASEIIRDAVG